MNVKPDPSTSNSPLRVGDWATAREAFRSRDLRQGLYDEAGLLMHDVIVNLHGDAHRSRRRLENRLFRRDTFLWYEREIIPGTIADLASAALTSGRGDLLPLARRTMMKLACVIAGLDIEEGDFDTVFALMNRLAVASTAFHATTDHDDLRSDGLAALAEVDRRFIQPAVARRADLVASYRRGEMLAGQLPKDVLTTLLVNQDALDLPSDVVVREVAYFPWVGSHSTSNAFVHAMNHVFEWCAANAGQRDILLDDPFRLQQLVHESLRLHPASPETHRIAQVDLTLGDRAVAAGQRVIIDMVKANRDPMVWGDDADAFVPGRPLPEDASPWGLTFGHGIHACLGMELAGGVAPDGHADPDTHLFGAITTMARILLKQGAEPDPHSPCRLDHSTVRVVYSTYPVVFHPARASR